MKAIVNILAIAISLLAIAEIGTACVTTGDFTFSEQITRPSSIEGSALFTYQDTATVSGWNEFSHKTSSSLGGFDSMSIFTTQPVPSGAAPASQSWEQATLNSMKGGNPADPYMGSEIDTWTTVGAASIPSTIPTDPTTIDPSKRYDSVLYNIHGFFNAGSATDSNGITTTNLRGIDTLIKSAQDDDIHVRVWDNAGYDYPVASSWADVNIPGHNGESQKFRQFNFADSRTWDLKSYNWINDMNIQYQEFPISFNEA